MGVPVSRLLLLLSAKATRLYYYHNSCFAVTPWFWLH